MNEELIGYFAKSIAGHDKADIYVIVKADAEYVYLADGKNKCIESPKRKKLKHIQIIRKKDSSIELKHKKQINIINEDIKRAIKLYISNQ